MTNSKDIIVKLKEVRDEKGLSYSDIIKLMEEKNIYPVSMATLSRVFSENSEEMNFNYENTIRPIAEALLDIETIEDDDNMDTQALKSLLQFKRHLISDMETKLKERDELIRELKASLAQEKLKRMEKVNEERERAQKSIDFLKDQILLKDRRYDALLATVSKKDELYTELLNQYLTCPYRKQNEAKA